MQTGTTKVVMIVDSVSPTPFALLRRAKHFEYRDDDEALQRFSAYEDTVKALTDECRRVLECISSANQSVLSPNTGVQNPSWSRFEDLGFSSIGDSSALSPTNGTSDVGGARDFSSLRTGARTRNNDFGRPTTPSWADFLSSGFADENNQSAPGSLLLPSQKLPPIGEAARVHSSQSHMRHGLQTDEDLEPGELASISQFDLDDTFWWVWMTSLAGEETTDRKAAFGRCTLIETRIPGVKWLLVEEQVKGASLGPEEGAYIAEKKGRFSFSRRGRLGRRKSTGKKPVPTKEPYNRTTSNTPMSKTSIGPDQHARVLVAAAQLAQKQKDQKASEQTTQRRARIDDGASLKTNSVLSLGPHLVSEAGPAMKWDKKFGEGAKDRNALRAQYLGDVTLGKGSRDNLLSTANGGGTSNISQNHSNRELPALPKSEPDAQSSRRDATPSPAPGTSTPITNTLKSPTVETSAVSASVRANNPLPPTEADTPGPQSGYLEQHPALRKPVPEHKPVVEPASETYDVEEHTHVPEAAPVKKPSPKKLKKKEGGGGFRKLFGKKKAETPVVGESAAPAEVVNYPSVQEQPDATRSVSRIDNHTPPVREPSPASSAEKQEPVKALPAETLPSSAVAAAQNYREPPRGAAQNTDKPEQRDAVQAFSRFDQGPMDDMPAFVPEDSDGEDDVLVSPSVPRQRTEHISHAQDPVSPVEPERTGDDASEESVDLTRQISPSQDRWAQIRKNAAERAARLSEEQARRSRSHSQSQSTRTEEGETSGEETIESRVARIKARVAELTGNMDGQPAPPRR